MLFASYVVANIPKAEFYDQNPHLQEVVDPNSWIIFLGICIFMIHLLIMIKVANRVLYPEINKEIEADEINLDNEPTKQSENAVETASKTKKGKKEENTK
jgi:hypothetical protein